MAAENEERIDADDGIPARHFPRLGCFQEEGFGAGIGVLYLHVTPQRSVEVSRHFSDEGNQPVMRCLPEESVHPVV